MPFVDPNVQDVEQFNAQYMIIKKYLKYRISAKFMSVLQGPIPRAIPFQKCHMNMGLILNSFGAM
jgi:hypothetical protein